MSTRLIACSTLEYSNDWWEVKVTGNLMVSQHSFIT